jgi:hypothetical protein
MVIICVLYALCDNHDCLFSGFVWNSGCAHTCDCNVLAQDFSTYVVSNVDLMQWVNIVNLILRELWIERDSIV